MKIDIGIKTKDREAVGAALQQVLIDTYTLRLKTQSHHWNVRGMHFGSLHELFEQQYTELEAAIDEIAERIRIVGVLTEGRFQEYAKRTRVEDGAPDASAEEMLRDLVKGNERVIGAIREALPVAQKAEDEGSFDLMVERLQAHEKAAWMLRSHLAE